MNTPLHGYLDATAATMPTSIAVVDSTGEECSYERLKELSDRLRDRLIHLGVGPGDRVGFCLPKSIDSVATIFGILKAGAVYVPLDPTAPAGRNAYILSDCSISALVVDVRLADALQGELAPLGFRPKMLIIGPVGGGQSLEGSLTGMQLDDPAPNTQTAMPSPDELAYLLYTSGSTGKPKGVMLSHRNATRFVEWCSDTFEPTPGDRFSSHAPFHFDLSILDIYTPLRHGSSLVLISEETGKDPRALVRLISESGISIWYSTPSILSLLVQYGELDRWDLTSLRSVLFAGEVFPIVHLKALKELLPSPDYYNLYGPTETNVCTFYKLPAEFPAGQTRPFPIGSACSHYETMVADDHGVRLRPGEEGELLVAGDGVMQGYWNLPDRTARAFFADSEGQRWYRTGDLVVEQADGQYAYVGRKDRMIKKRGYRVELGEIESCLYRHPNVKEAATVAQVDDRNGVSIVAHLSSRTGERISIIELKRFCSANLPGYMVPDLFKFHESLPKTSTDKTDYQRLD